MTTEPDLQEWEQNVVLELAQGTVPRWISAQHGVTEAQVRAVGEKFGWPRNTRQIKAAATRIRAQRAETAAGEPPAPGALEAGDGTGMEGQPQPAAETTDPEPAAEPVAEPTDAADAPEACKFADQHRHWASGGRPAGSVALWDDGVGGRLVECPCGGGLVVDPDAERQPEPAPDLDHGRRAADLADTAALLADVERLTPPRDSATLVCDGVRAIGPDGTEILVSQLHVEVTVNPGRALAAYLGGPDETWPPVDVRIAHELTEPGHDLVFDLAHLLPGDDLRAILAGGAS